MIRNSAGWHSPVSLDEEATFIPSTDVTAFLHAGENLWR